MFAQTRTNAPKFSREKLIFQVKYYFGGCESYKIHISCLSISKNRSTNLRFIIALILIVSKVFASFVFQVM